MSLNLLKRAVVMLGITASFNASAQFPEGFETTVPPTGWTAFNNTIGVLQDWETTTTANSGAQAAFVRYENVTGIAEDWLVTPLVPISAGAEILEFYQRQSFGSDFGSIYTVRVSTTSQTTGFTIIDTQVETDFDSNYGVHYVDLTAYIGQSVYIAFVMENDDGDNWFIDDVNLISTPCIAPINLQASNITTNSVDFTWAPFSSGTDFQVALLSSASPTPTTGTNVTNTTFNGTTLNAATDYDFYVREACSPTEPLIISATYDGPLTGGHPKGIELYAIEDINDLSIYGVSSANNGSGTTTSPEFTFPSATIAAGTYIYVAADSAGFFDYFGFNADYINNAMSINGDDAIELYKDGSVIDVFGDVNLDGTGQTWDYLDGWAARISGSLTNGGIFNDAEWTYSGIDALDGETTNATATTPIPVGVFTAAGDYSPWEMISITTLCDPFVGDSIQNPIEIATLPYSDTSSTASCFTNQIGNSSADAFYQYIVTDSCMISIDISLCNSSYDTYLRVYDNQLVQIDFNDDDCGTQSALLGFEVFIGDTLNIVVEGYTSNVGDYIIDITPNYAPAPVLTNQTNLVCAADTNGMATFNTGETTATYLWDANTGNQSDSTAINLAQGTYHITVTYPGGCVFMDSVEIISASPEMTSNPMVTDVLCFGGNDGTAVLNESGGSGPLVVDWESENPNSLSAGTFNFTITDSLGCTIMDSVEIAEPSEIVLSATSISETAGNDGSIDLTVTGGTSPYTFSWTNGAGNVEDPTGLAGNEDYTVTVTDLNGCSDTLTINVGSSVSVISIDNMANWNAYPNPSNGTFTLEAKGQTGIYQVRGINALGQIILSETIDASAAHDFDFSNLERGTYTLQLISSEGHISHLRIVLM